MRLFTLLLYILAVLGIFLLVYNLLMPVIYGLYINTTNIANNVTVNKTAKLYFSQMDVLKAVMPWFHILDIAVAVTIIVVIIAIFLYTRRR